MHIMHTSRNISPCPRRLCVALWVLLAVSASSLRLTEGSSTPHLEQRRLQFSKLAKDADDAVHGQKYEDAIRYMYTVARPAYL
jgi:hypothetical protein